MATISKDQLADRIIAAKLALDSVKAKMASLKLTRSASAMKHDAKVINFQKIDGNLTPDGLYGPNVKAALDWYLQSFPTKQVTPLVNPKFAAIKLTWVAPTLEVSTKPTTKPPVNATATVKAPAPAPAPATVTVREQEVQSSVSKKQQDEALALFTKQMAELDKAAAAKKAEEAAKAKKDLDKFTKAMTSSPKAKQAKIKADKKLAEAQKAKKKADVSDKKAKAAKAKVKVIAKSNDTTPQQDKPFYKNVPLMVGAGMLGSVGLIYLAS